jgi:AcrR family transcriptional regulator
MARVKRRMAGEDRRAQLVDVAKRTFSERAYDEVSMDDIAHHAKISKALLYQHFPAKRDLYIATLGVTSDELVATIVAIDRSQAPVDRVRAALHNYLDYITKHASSFLSLVRGGIGDDPSIAAIKEQFRRRIVEELLRDSPFGMSRDARVDLATRGWIGFVEAASIEWCVTPKMTRDELCDLLAHVLFESLKHVALKVAK